MLFTITLLIAIGVTIGVSSLASAAMRSASATLPESVRQRIYEQISKLGMYWHSLEWIGVALILLNMLTSVLSTKTSVRVLGIAAGVALFCLANAGTAWHASSVYKREAPNSDPSKSAFRAALVVTLAEIVLLGVVLWVVCDRLNWFDAAKPNASGVEETAAESEGEKGLWLDEAQALKELNWLKRDEVRMIVDSGGIKIRQVAGKTVYSSPDIERLKKQHAKNAEIPD